VYATQLACDGVEVFHLAEDALCVASRPIFSVAITDFTATALMNFTGDCGRLFELRFTALPGVDIAAGEIDWRGFSRRMMAGIQLERLSR
jgi:hypothetical protein